MARSKSPDNAGRDQAGKFRPGISGNPTGKPPGTRHKATLAVEALLEGECQALGRKAIELALAGDTTALRLCLERLLPPRKDSPIVLEIPPINAVVDTVMATSAIVRAVGAGEITPSEGQALSAMVDNLRRSMETQDLEARLIALEERAVKK